MSEVKIISVDAALAAKTHLQQDTRAVEIAIPTDRPVTIHAVANAKMLQRVQVFDGEGRQHFAWEGRGEGRTIGTGSRTFTSPTLILGCAAYYDDGWVVSDLNIRQEQDDGKERVILCCEDGGDMPGDWDDLVVTIEW